MTARKRGERPIGTGPKPPLSRTALRRSCEHRVTRVLSVARKSLWTLRQVRHALLRARERLLANWEQAPLKRRASSAWYRAIRVVCGVPLRKLTDLRQLELPWRTT